MLGIVGLLTRDIVDGGEPRVGGAPYYSGRALAGLGNPGVVVTKYSSVDVLLAQPLHDLGTQVVWRPAQTTTSFRLDYSDEGRTAYIDALGESWTPSDVADWVLPALDGAVWVHAGALSRADFPSATLEALKGDRFLCLDGQGLVRPGRTGKVIRDGDIDPDVFEHISALKLSEAEANSLGIPVEDLPVPEVIVTHGAGGATVHADGRREVVPTQELELEDATGAGDVFITAYLGARTDGAAPIEAAVAANSATFEVLQEWHGR